MNTFLQIMTLVWGAYTIIFSVITYHEEGQKSPELDFLTRVVMFVVVITVPTIFIIRIVSFLIMVVLQYVIGVTYHITFTVGGFYWGYQDRSKWDWLMRFALATQDRFYSTRNKNALAAYKVTINKHNNARKKTVKVLAEEIQNRNAFVLELLTAFENYDNHPTFYKGLVRDIKLKYSDMEKFNAHVMAKNIFTNTTGEEEITENVDGEMYEIIKI